MRWCQFIDWLQFETRPSLLLNSGMAYKALNRSEAKQQITILLCNDSFHVKTSQSTEN